MPLTRFSANTEIGVNWSITRSARNVSTIANPPTSNGNSAATRPRKNQNDSNSSSGNASSSARARSLVVRSLSSWVVSAYPPKRTLIPASCAPNGGFESAMRTREIAVVASGVLANAASTTVSRPSRESNDRARIGSRPPIVRRALEPLLGGEQRRDARGGMALGRVRTHVAGPTQQHDHVVVRALPRRGWIAAFVRSYCDAGSWKSLPELPSIPVTGTPSTAAITNSTPAAASTRRGRLVASVVNRPITTYSSISRRCTAQRVSSWRLESWSLRSTAETCASTVFAEMPSWAAISLYMYPRAMCWSTSRSRGVSRSSSGSTCAAGISPGEGVEHEAGQAG